MNFTVHIVECFFIKIFTHYVDTILVINLNTNINSFIYDLECIEMRNSVIVVVKKYIFYLIELSNEEEYIIYKRIKSRLCLFNQKRIGYLKHLSRC